MVAASLEKTSAGADGLPPRLGFFYAFSRSFTFSKEIGA
jgi:hypothetical protein